MAMKMNKKEANVKKLKEVEAEMESLVESVDAKHVDAKHVDAKQMEAAKTKQQMEAEKVLEEMQAEEQAEAEKERVVTVPSTVLTWLEKMVLNEKEETVKALASRYNFDLADAREWLGLKSVKLQQAKKEEKKKEEKKEQGKQEKCMILPFCGKRVEKWCDGLQVQGGLYSQCQTEKKEGSVYCGKCGKQAEKNGDGEPNAGTMTARLASAAAGEAFKNKKGQVVGTLKFYKVLAKSGVTQAAAEAAAASVGLEIPEEEWIVTPVVKGVKTVKKKSADVVEEEESASEAGGSEAGGSEAGAGESEAGASASETGASEAGASASEAGAGGKRGRPAKKKSVRSVLVEETTDSEAESVKEKPKRKSKATKKGESEELLAALFAEVAEETEPKKAAKAPAKAPAKAAKAPAKAAKAPAKAPKAAAKAPAKAKAEPKKAEVVAEELTEEEVEDEVEIEITEYFTEKGKKYGRTEENLVYDVESAEHVGMWNGECIEFEESDEE
jgi:hypothetical protein